MIKILNKDSFKKYVRKNSESGNGDFGREDDVLE